jgi:hypothetical protein
MAKPGRPKKLKVAAAKVVKKGKVREVSIEPGMIIPIEKGEIVVIDKDCASVSLSKRVDKLEEQMQNIYAALAEVISLTGTGRILDKYDIKPYDLTKEDLERGQYKPK